MGSVPEWLVDPRLIWFVVGLLLFLAEFAAPGLVIFFFGLGAWVVTLICFVVNIGLTTQLVLFLVFSIIFLALLRKQFKSLFYRESSKNGYAADAGHEYIGKRVVVTKEIQLDLKGRIEYCGTQWDAEADVPIPEGATVEIIGKDNITFKVIPV